MKLRYKLSLFNIASKALFGLLFLLLMPRILERVNIIQTDNQLIEKREQVIDWIAEWGVEYFISDRHDDAFGSYNILKEEYISLERVDLPGEWNFIEVTHRMVDEEIIEYRVLNYAFYIDGEMYLLEIGKSLSSIRQTEKNFRTFTLVFLVVFLLFTSFTDISFAAFLIRPLERISQKLRKTHTPEQYDKSIINTGTTEFAQLDKTLAELMQKIAALFDKEKQITANISHELLTPVSVLRSTLENLLAYPGLDDHTAEKIEESLKTLYRLKSMVNSLLLIARVESEQFLRHESFFLTPLLHEIHDELLPIARDKKISLTIETAEDFRMSNANRQLVFIMIYNVLNNALKYTPAGGRVTILMQKKTKDCVLSISDTGPGIAPEEREQLFARFRKKPTGHENTTGIGLAIAKAIADFHHINLHVASTGEAGSKFSFIFK